MKLAEFQKYYPNASNQRVAGEQARLMANVDATGVAVRQEEDAAGP